MGLKIISHKTVHKINLIATVKDRIAVFEISPISQPPTIHPGSELTVTYNSSNDSTFPKGLSAEIVNRTSYGIGRAFLKK